MTKIYLQRFEFMFFEGTGIEGFFPSLCFVFIFQKGYGLRDLPLRYLKAYCAVRFPNLTVLIYEASGRDT
jgi:hypothetical protein